MSRRLALLLAAVALLALSAAPASASLGERSSFGGEGTGNGQFEWTSGIALDSGNRIFASDCQLNRIEVFNPDHSFLGQLGGPFAGGPGATGSGPAQFRCPFDLATDGNKYVYVADLQNQRVQRFTGFENDVPLDYINSFVLRGTDDQACAPYGVDVDPSGNVWVSGGPTRDECQVVAKFDRNGRQILRFGSRGNRNGQFYGYEHVASDAAGNVYVTDYANGRVQEFDTNGTFLKTFGHEGTGDGDFYGPHGLDVDPAGNLWVAETGVNWRIQEFTPDSQFAAKFPLGGPVGSTYLMPYDVASDSDCNVYATATNGTGDGPEKIVEYGQSEAPFCRASTPAPVSGAGGTVSDGTPGTGAQDVPDTASPTVTVTGTGARFSGRRGFTLPVRCNEGCSLIANATVSVPNGAAKVYRLSARGSGAKGKTVKLRFSGPARAKRAIAAALKRGRRLKAKVSITAVDRATNIGRSKATVKLTG